LAKLVWKAFQVFQAWGLRDHLGLLDLPVLRDHRDLRVFPVEQSWVFLV